MWPEAPVCHWPVPAVFQVYSMYVPTQGMADEMANVFSENLFN